MGTFNRPRNISEHQDVRLEAIFRKIETEQQKKLRTAEQTQQILFGKNCEKSAVENEARQQQIINT